MIDAAVYAELLRQASVGSTGLGLLSAVVAGLVAAGYRRVTTRAPPAGVAVGIGLSAAAGYLSYTVFASGALFEGIPLEHRASAGYLLATFAVAGVAGTAGGRFGDRIARQVLDIDRIDANGEPASIVRAARLAVALELPGTIDDADGYRPVDSSVRRALAGTVIEVPHDSSISERRDRIERHLERDYDLDYATVTMAADGSVERVRVGRREPGLGSLLPPSTVAVAIRTDPLPDASVGDPVEIWTSESRERGRTTDDERERERRRDQDQAQERLVATGTLRASTGSVATVLVDAGRARDLAADERYRLVAHPDETTDGYEFAAAVRRADETVTTLTVEPGGSLVGEFVGWLPGRVLVLERDGDRQPLPPDRRTLEAGDECWLLASPAELAALEAETGDTATSVESETGERAW
ncbi:hypothetical protein [Halopiger xanaduensis]|uniref:RCK C-terminal domain-containing protein n=1 Tax=Halopiger xanaduensis (strain DSM 18323 / JCM 14033 / SH-6) TaxID=797210 RepID=F8D920_HALXS|nr:hypothetical protein [Halopiger xanaduensis]AEH37407.1 hypothetical protein Halxa_2791 [Halopiger xanaduensis SH-6]